MAVKNWITSNSEKVQFITPDGVVYNLHDPYSKSVLAMNGWGLPPAEIADVRGPFQHGTNPLTVRIPPRMVTLDIYHVGCNRDDYWTKRAGLVNALRHNRTNINNPTPGKLRWYRSDGSKRQLDVMIRKGPDFPEGTGSWNEFSYQDSLEFVAHNPIIYNPDQVTDSFDTLICGDLTQLTFPLIFNGVQTLIFGQSFCAATTQLTINYGGNWQEFPLITVYGPALNFRITHDQTGIFINLEDYQIPAGDSVVFDLRYGIKTVTLTSSGDSLLGYISQDSGLGTFAIEPDPITANGINTVSVYIEDGTAESAAVFQYYDRYIGI